MEVAITSSCWQLAEQYCSVPFLSGAAVTRGASASSQPCYQPVFERQIDECLGIDELSFMGLIKEREAAPASLPQKLCASAVPTGGGWLPCCVPYGPVRGTPGESWRATFPSVTASVTWTWQPDAAAVCPPLRV
ncbi:hypothetical protein NHX12_030482 [Muraenolepis orangiensis]|uniref:Uncharacterized protein n=1 Tax=Muraenolepis orangiensis TaxID=630683 RepID=A0A9Q0EBU7_9TELE|nr:hypothetical protein NHX12_030482 [Muraenolepis orangiensis]